MKIDKRVWFVVGINWLILIGLYIVGRIQEQLSTIIIPDELDPYWYQDSPFYFAIVLSSIYAVVFLKLPIKLILLSHLLTILSGVVLLIGSLLLFPMRIGI